MSTTVKMISLLMACN